jgi:hypothetical protein
MPILLNSLITILYFQYSDEDIAYGNYVSLVFAYLFCAIQISLPIILSVLFITKKDEIQSKQYNGAFGEILTALDGNTTLPALFYHVFFMLRRLVIVVLVFKVFE